jgi:asparagine synthase (glutamine-hydrolysing)
LEKQPFFAPEGHVLLWDGRLDNRNTLLATLGLSNPITDVELVAACYAKWGKEFPQHLMGDFSLCLWDPRYQCLMLARDPFGARQLFYYKTAARIFWASDIAPLVRLADDISAIDEEYIAGYMTGTEQPGHTPYKSISSVLPGTVLVVTRNGIQSSQFWDIDPGNEIRYATDGQYEEHFFQLFQEAVSCRLRVEGVAFAELSGGLDSSSIVCMADHVLTHEHVQASSLETVSYVYDRSRSSDERVCVQLIEEQRKKRGHHLAETECPIFASFPGEESVLFPNPMHPFAEAMRRLGQTMSDYGSRVLLSGQGGDHMFLNETCYYPILADLALERRFGDLWSFLKEWSRRDRKNYLRLLWEGVLWPLAPGWLRARLMPKKLQVAEWLEEEFIRRNRCRERVILHPASYRFPHAGKQRQYTLLRHAISWVSSAYYYERNTIDLTYPFLHRPLVEFLMAIPMDQLQRPWETRSIQRRALKGLLPERIAKRTTKSGPDEAAHRAIVRQSRKLQELAASPRMCSLGYVNLQKFQLALSKARHGQGGLHPVIRTVALENWLRAHQARCTQPRWSLLNNALSEVSQRV